MDAEFIGTGAPPEHMTNAFVEVLRIIEVPTLIVAVLVVYLMYRLLVNQQRTMDKGFKELFNELHANTKLLSEFSGTTKALIEMLHKRRGQDESDN